MIFHLLRRQRSKRSVVCVESNLWFPFVKKMGQWMKSILREKSSRTKFNGVIFLFVWRIFSLECRWVKQNLKSILVFIEQKSKNPVPLIFFLKMFRRQQKRERRRCQLRDVSKIIFSMIRSNWEYLFEQLFIDSVRWEFSSRLSTCSERKSSLIVLHMMKKIFLLMSSSYKTDRRDLSVVASNFYLIVLKD